MTSKFTNVLEVLKPINSTALTINFLLALGASWLLFFKYHSLAPSVPLWFSKDWGEARLANPSWLWVLPASSFIILVVNNISAGFFKKIKPISLMLVWFSVFFALICFYTLYRLLVLAS